MRVKVTAILGLVVIASLLSAGTPDAQTQARPKPPATTKPKSEPAQPRPPAATGSVQVTGEVVRPGKIALKGPAVGVIEALERAGGLTRNAGDEVIVSPRPKPGAAPAFITISRQDLEAGKPGVNVVLQDGDIINVPKVKRYFITGSVKNPGSYSLHYGTTIAQAIALAGGLTERGSDKDIKIVRPPTLKSLRAVTVDARLDDKVQPNDEIQIQER